LRRGGGWEKGCDLLIGTKDLHRATTLMLCGCVVTGQDGSDLERTEEQDLGMDEYGDSALLGTTTTP
jgi:hypothetical protein